MANTRLAPRALGSVGLSWQAETSLKGTIALLRGKTGEDWVYTEEPMADAIVYEPNNALARAMQRRFESGMERTVFIRASNDDGPDLSLKIPFGASRLVDCLNRVSSQLAGVVTAASAIALPSLCQRLDDALQLPGAVAIAVSSGDRWGVYDIAQQELHWPRALDLDEMGGLLASEIELSLLTAADAPTVIDLKTDAPHRISGESLLWGIGTTRSKGLLLQRIDANRRYRLRRWPDFGAIGHRSLDLRCASLLTQRAMTPRELATVAGIPLSLISTFINGSALCGLLGEELLPGDRQPVTIPAGARFGGVLKRLRKAFALA